MASNNSDTKEVTKLDIRVFTQPQYLEMHSDPARKQYRFAYRIRIENHSEETVRLLRRYWKISNANGKVDEVEGAGVVGETPTLRPGAHYDYTSGSNFETPIGFMEGYYTFEVIHEHGAFPDTFKVTIPSFRLAKPGALH